MRAECQFALCRKEPTSRASLRSECGHTVQENLPVCAEHALPGVSPMPHICGTCDQRVYMLREPGLFQE